MNKRLTAILGAGLLVVQMLGIGTAAASSQQDSECDFGSDNLEVTLGAHDGPNDDATLYIDDSGRLHCDGGTGSGEQAVATIDSITVEMDDEDSTGVLTILLDDDNANAAEWPDFDTFDIDVTTPLIIDGEYVGSSAANDLRVVVDGRKIEFNGTEATYVAPSLEITGGDRNDVLDASRVAVRTKLYGGSGKDTLKGGSKNDLLEGESGLDVLWGGLGNDTVDCGGDQYDQGWGQAGFDTIRDCYTAAPGVDDDEVYGATIASYTDLTSGVSWTNDGSSIATGGGAGDDVYDSSPDKVYGGQGDDAFVDAVASLVRGYGGDDLIKVDSEASGGDGDDLVVALDYDTDNKLYGNGGDDVLKGKQGDDFLAAGPGRDEAWGGPGADTCGAEYVNRCEYLKR